MLTQPQLPGLVTWCKESSNADHCFRNCYCAPIDKPIISSSSRIAVEDYYPGDNQGLGKGRSHVWTNENRHFRLHDFPVRSAQGGRPTCLQNLGQSETVRTATPGFTIRFVLFAARRRQSARNRQVQPSAHSRFVLTADNRCGLAGARTPEKASNPELERHGCDGCGFERTRWLQT